MKFRSKERIPALTYAYKHENNFTVMRDNKKVDKKFSTIWRCAQCRAGLQIMNEKRSYDDERMIRLIGDPSKDYQHPETTVHIFDARPYINAVGMQFAGKGYEYETFYKNCKIEFLDIHNIHKVRDSINAVVKAVNSDPVKILGNLEKSGHFEFLSTIL